MNPPATHALRAFFRVDTPFEAVKAEINSTFIGLSFDASVLPVPEQNTVSFCSNLDTSSVDNLSHDLLWITKIITIVLVLVLFLLLAGQCALEWYKWRCLQFHLQFTRQAWLSDPTVVHPDPSQPTPVVTLSDHNLLMLQADAHHPLLTRIANGISTRFGFSPSQHIHIRWFLHYVFHPPALACFLIGFFGLLSVQIQLLAVGPLEAKYSAQAAASVQDLSTSIATQMNHSMYNQSASYAGQVNSRVNAVQSSINEGLFGWVNGTTTTLNTTLNNFYTDVQNLMTTVFNGTVLETPAQDFVKCLIGSKVQALEEALTFLNENLNVDLPRVNNSVLVLSPNDVNEITQPIATAAIGGSQDNSSGLIGRLVATYVNSLKKERIMFAIFLGLWGVVVMMGLAIVFWHSYARNWVESYRKRKWRKEQRDALEGFSVPLYDGMPGHTKDTEKAEGTPLRSFTPLPEPRSAFSLNPFSRSTQPHPLRLLEPKFEKSWDSFFHDSGEKQQQPSGPSTRSVSKSARFLNLGKKNSSGNNSEMNPSEDKPKTNWFRSFWTKSVEPSSSAPGDSVVNPASRPPRPQLMISTERAASLKPHDLPKIEVSPTQDEPGSAWSVSPTPGNLPSTKTFPPRKAPPTTFPPPPPLPPSHARNRKDVNVPTDVGSTPPDHDPSPLAMPLHNGFEQRPPSAPQSLALYPKFIQPHSLLAPPKEQYGRSRNILGVADSNPNPNSSSRRQLTTTHGEGTINPFSTPFDDDAHDPSGEKRATNPFVAL